MKKFKLKLLSLALITFFPLFKLTNAIIIDLLLGIIVLEEVNKRNRKWVIDNLENVWNQEYAYSSENYAHDNKSENRFDNTKSSSNSKKFTFKDLAGDIPEDVKEIVEFLKKPEKFRKVGAQMPRGILLVGPPGTGKTSIARAIAGEADAHFFHASASQFIEVYVGVGPQRIRELFDNARAAIKKGPQKKAIVFIDELDAIGGARHMGENSEYRNTLNELLNQMDGFNVEENIIVLGATNTPESIDTALKRPGRFDRIVEIGLPDPKSRKEILEHYAKKIKHAPNIDFDKIVASTQGFSSADLKNLVNEAAVRAAREDANLVRQKHFDKALEDILKKRIYN